MATKKKTGKGDIDINVKVSYSIRMRQLILDELEEAAPEHNPKVAPLIDAILLEWYYKRQADKKKAR